MPIYSYFQKTPIIEASAFVAPSADIVGDVCIGAQSGIWFGCVIRGDVARIRIGQRTNIQDGTILHVTRGGHDTLIGSDVTIGHQCLLHACQLEDACFVGMGSLIMDDVVVETGAMIAAGSLVTQGKRVKYRELWAGRPAKLLRELTDAEHAHIMVSAANYVLHAEEYLGLNAGITRLNGV